MTSNQPNFDHVFMEIDPETRAVSAMGLSFSLASTVLVEGCVEAAGLYLRQCDRHRAMRFPCNVAVLSVPSPSVHFSCFVPR